MPDSEIKPVRVRFGLAAKLATGLAIGAACFFALFAWMHLRLEQSHLESLVRLSAERIDDIIRGAAWQHMLADDRPALYQLMRNVGAEPGVRRLRLMNEQGLITFSTDRAEAGTSVDRQAEACVVCHEGATPRSVLDRANRSRIFLAPDGRRILASILPIENRPDCSSAACHVHPASRKVLGVIDVHLALDEVDQNLASHRRSLLLMFVAGALCLCVFAVGFVLVTLHRPIRELLVGTARVARGDLGYRLPVRSTDEVGLLSASFNRMTERLEQAQDDLESWNRTLEKRVAEKTRDLEVAHRGLVRSEKMASLGRLAATVAHEVNNPLFGMLTYARLTKRDLAKLQGEDKVRARMNEHLSIIERESVRCGDLMKSLLAFSRQNPIRHAPFDVNEIVNRSAQLVRHQMELAEIELVLTLAPDLPPLDGDAAQIQQILVALLVNATEAIGRKGTIEVLTEPIETGLRLTIRDDGPGIPDEVRAQIFEPFFTTKENQHRTGLGLAVAKDIVERHGGAIHAGRSPRGGAEFVIDLPWQAPPEAAAPMPESEPVSSGDTPCPKV